MRLVLVFALLFGMAAPARAAEAVAATVLSDPQPSIEHPREIVMSLSEQDSVRVNAVISNVGNIQKFYGADNVRIALVVFGPAVHSLLKGESRVKARIDGLVAIGVEVLACNATLESLHLSPKDVLPGVVVIPNGLPEIVERQLAGWTYVRP